MRVVYEIIEGDQYKSELIIIMLHSLINLMRSDLITVYAYTILSTINIINNMVPNHPRIDLVLVLHYHNLISPILYLFPSKG